MNRSAYYTQLEERSDITIRMDMNLLVDEAVANFYQGFVRLYGNTKTIHSVSERAAIVRDVVKTCIRESLYCHGIATTVPWVSETHRRWAEAQVRKAFS